MHIYTVHRYDPEGDSCLSLPNQLRKKRKRNVFILKTSLHNSFVDIVSGICRVHNHDFLANSVRTFFSTNQQNTVVNTDKSNLVAFLVFNLLVQVLNLSQIFRLSNLLRNETAKQAIPNYGSPWNRAKIGINCSDFFNTAF